MHNIDIKVLISVGSVKTNTKTQPISKTPCSSYQTYHYISLHSAWFVVVHGCVVSACCIYASKTLYTYFTTPVMVNCTGFATIHTNDFGTHRGIIMVDKHIMAKKNVYKFLNWKRNVS